MASSPAMEDVRIGIWVRTARLRAGWRQSDLAAMAGVSKSSVSRLERGELGSMTLRQCRRIADCLCIELFLVPHSIRLGDVERQVDKRHAALVDAVVERVTEIGWTAETEYSFNHYGDRGSVDVLGWKEAKRALLIVEVKSELRDLQETLRAIDVKRRVVPGRVRAERGWNPAAVAVALVLPDLSTQRSIVGRFPAIFDAAFPARTVDVRHWLNEPDGDLRGLWFLPVSRDAVLTQRFRGRQRVRPPRTAQLLAVGPGLEPDSAETRAQWVDRAGS